MPKRRGILHICDDENLQEFNWVLNNGQTFKFKCCSWNGNKFDSHSITYLRNLTEIVIHETDYIYDIVCNFRFNDGQNSGLLEYIESDDDCIVNKSVVAIGPEEEIMGVIG